MKKLITFFALFLSCIYEDSIYFKGEYNTIILSSGNLKRAKNLIKRNLEIVQFTPREEKIFDIIDIDSLEKKDKFLYKNYIILATPCSDNFKLFKEIFRDIKESGLYFKSDPFLRGSFMIAIYGEKEEEVLSIISRQKELIFNTFYHKVMDDLRKIAYFPGERKEFSEKVFKKIGLKVKIPNGYRVFKEGDNYIIFNINYPDRFVMFWKIDSKVNLVPEEIIELRNKIAKEVYAGDSVLVGFVNYKYLNLGGKKALYITGAWGNLNLKVGGGFESLIFEKNGTTYFIDIGIYEPRKNKLKFLKIMESWAFNIGDE
ncbi:MAG: DUF4837 family protein [Candidatus Hydrothermales bacterium]